MRPRPERASATRCHVVVESRVDVSPEGVGVDGRGARECRDGSAGWDECASAQRCELADRDSVARHHEGLSAVERAHHIAAVVPELSLRDLVRHRPYCSTRATVPPAASGLPVVTVRRAIVGGIAQHVGWNLIDQAIDTARHTGRLTVQQADELKALRHADAQATVAV